LTNALRPSARKPVLSINGQKRQLLPLVWKVWIKEKWK
jgi:hypothetical protein